MQDQELVWNELAESWHNFRQRPEPIANYFLDNYTKNAGRIIDVGCGNARNLIPFKNFICYGVDFSSKMLEKAKIVSDKYDLDLKLYKAELTKLSFRDNFFDYALMIASLHHLKSKQERFTALKELHRILKQDGLALITVWNKWQLRFLFSKKNNFVTWKVKDKIYFRYYYLFNYFELKNLIKQVGFKILKSKFGRNLIFIVKK